MDEVVGTVSESAFEGMPAGYETQAQALLRFKNGKTACFQGLYASHALSDTPFFQVYGSKVGREVVACSRLSPPHLKSY